MEPGFSAYLASPEMDKAASTSLASDILHPLPGFIAFLSLQDLASWSSSREREVAEPSPGANHVCFMSVELAGFLSLFPF